MPRMMVDAQDGSRLPSGAGERRAAMGQGDFQYIPHTGGMVRNVNTGRYTHEHHFLAIEKLHHLEAMANVDGDSAAELQR